jgi:hypothetical protein
MVNNDWIAPDAAILGAFSQMQSVVDDHLIIEALSVIFRSFPPFSAVLRSFATLSAEMMLAQPQQV